MKTPEQVIEDALARLPTVQVFQNEQTAQQWVATAATGVIRHKIHLLGLTPEERDRVDPIEAGYVHAKDLGTRPRRQRIPWIDALLDSVSDSCSCVLVPLSGTMSSWLIGRHTDRTVALHLLASLVPTAERLGQDAYLHEYHSNRRAGTVEAARGSKERWHLQFVDSMKEAFDSRVRELTQEDAKAGEALQAARQDITTYMNENFLPTRGNRTERLSTTTGRPPQHRKPGK